LNPKRLALGVGLGLAGVAGVVLGLSKIVATHEWVFQGKSASQWRQELISDDAARSQRAGIVLNDSIIPELTDAALHDTNDSGLRLAMAVALNDLPGLRVSHLDATGRRGDSINELGKLGPASKRAIPVLIEILKGHDDAAVRGAAAAALGQIHGEPDVCIPALLSSLGDSDVDEQAAEALGHFGPLAKAAVPKLLYLSVHGDKGTRHEAGLALPKIDPEAAAKAGTKRQKIKASDHE
jgi:HEAT repeat protein